MSKELLDIEKSGKSIARVQQVGYTKDKDGKKIIKSIQPVEVATSAESVYIYGLNDEKRVNLRYYIRLLEERILNLNNASTDNSDAVNKLKEKINKDIVFIKEELEKVSNQEENNKLQEEINANKKLLEKLSKEIESIDLEKVNGLEKDITSVKEQIKNIVSTSNENNTDISNLEEATFKLDKRTTEVEESNKKLGNKIQDILDGNIDLGDIDLGDITKISLNEGGKDNLPIKEIIFKKIK